MKKNDIINVIISDYGSNGEGVAKFNEYVVFVPYALVGERLNVKVLKIQKNIIFAKIEKIINKSEHRVEPVCPVFKRCGGCQLQHLSYDAQLELKTGIVKNNLKKIAGYEGEVLPCEKSEKVYKYRNKMQLPVGVNGLGFYANNSHDIVPISTCPLHDEWGTEVIRIVHEYIKIYNITCYNEATKKGEIRHIVARYMQGKLMLVIVTTLNELSHTDFLINQLTRCFSEFSLYHNKNNSSSNVIMGEKFTLLYGKGEQDLNVSGVEYSVSPMSFMQINFDVQNKIYDKVASLCSECDYIIDAYSGAGLLSSIIAKKCKQVYGIEIVQSATENANKLKNINKIDNLTNINGDCAVELPKLIASLSGRGIVVLDPPRKGCDEKVLNAINSSLPEKVIYISCNSATLARDVSILSKEYKLTYVQPYDMFPQTKHVETLVCLERK